MDGQYRNKLIQVAGVAVSMIEDFDYGVADSSKTLTADRPKTTQSKRTQTAPILSQIFEERQNQDEKWGPQHHVFSTWMVILMEEVGEAADEIELAGEFRQLIDEIGLLGRRCKAALDSRWDES